MERRLFERKAVVHEVTLFYTGVGILNCVTRDVSLEGVYVDTNKVSIPHNAKVELVFTARPSEEGRQYRFGGKVVRSHAGGVGIHFREYHQGSFDYLQKLASG